ncbi:hypothetical protein Gasu2_42480 [Galdieria sulphuraria]|uniref:Uncharacterized protein n=1 Tax=Galdieria sulphuraria TaxID=130081 RepID=M2WRP9_GALSU|nr:uncharacterized protein Gasu_59030 [Galdieria sulphuraria]EME26500.1 hypothetical protein Gasu_59030 [Galdieria sulphuraria]GJD10028.1 hypothetical protein Gasu2_42480 [Galdieria sulphuraria]|eukprot:XP_005703020.1 hypothetical protein Gasu_59030 [Galdieria sulphuraria]
MSFKKHTFFLFLLCCFFFWNFVECEKENAEEAHNTPSSFILRVPIVLTLTDHLQIEIPLITEAPEPTDIPVLIPVSQLPNATGVPNNIPFPVEYNL